MRELARTYRMDLAEEQLENEALQRGGLNRVQKGIANLRQLGRLISAAPDLKALHELAKSRVFDRPKLRRHVLALLHSSDQVKALPRSVLP